MASLILGILGKKRSGKDTFASQLVEAHGYTRLAFADALKATMLDLNPYVSADYRGDPIRLASVVAQEGWERAKETPEVRRLLQAHGVALRDHVSPNVWVDAVARKAAEVSGPVVITDVRFPNEADFIEAELGKLVRIVRPGLPSDDQHISEIALDDRRVHHTVVNGGTVGDLLGEADLLARHYWR